MCGHKGADDDEDCKNENQSWQDDTGGDNNKKTKCKIGLAGQSRSESDGKTATAEIANRAMKYSNNPTTAEH